MTATLPHTARRHPYASELAVRPVPQTSPAPAPHVTWRAIDARTNGGRGQPVQSTLPLEAGSRTTAVRPAGRTTPRAPQLRPRGSRPPAATPPEPAIWAARLTVALLEVEQGARPATQVMRYCSPEVFDSVVRRHRPTDGRHRPVRVRRVRVDSPAVGVVEASVVVADWHRVRALALRMEAVDDRWVVTALMIG